jgi:DNA-binding SARP family transcriptional activator
MLHLRTFGGLSVKVGDEPGGGAGHQRKTLALLALLATAGRRGLSRDKLIAYLWPDADEEHARALLKQACYVLRRDLHAPDLLLGTTELRLNPAVIESDIQRFEAALEQGDAAQTVAVYAGPFLDGFYLHDSSEFEHWVEAERNRLERQAGEALETLATSAAQQGDNCGAAEYWRRRYSLDRLDSRVAQELMRALARSGDRAGALQLAQEHESVLREELDAGPDEAIVRLAEVLRRESNKHRLSSPPLGESQPTSGIEPNDVRSPEPSRWRIVPAAGKLVATGVLVLAAALLLSPTGRPAGPAKPPRVATVNLLGPDGRGSICHHLPRATVISARLLNASPPPAQGGFDAFACPESQLRLRAGPGTWYLRVELPGTDALDGLPWRHLETSPVVVDRGDQSRDIVIREGSPLGGRATFEGKPIPDVGLTLGYDRLRVLAAYGKSGPDGRWVEFLGRSPVVLQNGVRYTMAGTCMFLGARLVNRLPSEGSLFPTEFRSLDCTLVTGSVTRFTHDRTRLVVTPMPGEIGGLSEDFIHDLGFGWGVQYPVAPGQSPSHEQWRSHIWQGGLLIGIAPDRVLSGVSMRGQADCGASCRDLGLDGQVRFKASPEQGKEVTWQYSDARSQEGVGLGVVQQSFDGRPPADYVLLRFAITNGGRSRVSFHAGFFGDWDVGDDAEDDVGFTEMGGRLMYQTNGAQSQPKDPYIGTLLVGDAPSTGSFFFRKETLLSLTEQVDALAGRVVQPRSDLAGDNRYIHGAVRSRSAMRRAPSFGWLWLPARPGTSSWPAPMQRRRTSKREGGRESSKAVRR